MRHKERENYRKKKLYKVLPFMAALCVCGSSVGGNVYADTVDSATVAEESSEETEGVAEEAATTEVRPVSIESAITKPDNVEQNGYDVVFVIDNSQCLNKQLVNARNDAIRPLISYMAGANFNVGLVYFSEGLDAALGLTSMENSEGSQKVLGFFEDEADAQYSMSGSSGNDAQEEKVNIGEALLKAKNMLKSSSSQRKQLVVLFGESNENIESADAQTAAQALQKNNVPIYCVYRETEDNAQNEDTLKKIVNYYDDNTDNASERFYKVAGKQVQKLQMNFREVFFDMQNIVTKLSQKPDSDGNIKFYVPSIGIRKMNIYINKKAAENVELKKGDESVPVDAWEIGNGTFFTVENPEAGVRAEDSKVGDLWTLQVGDSALTDVSAKITYLADPGVSVEVKSTDSEDSSGKNNQLIVHFFDEDENEIPIDSGANIEVKISTEDGTVLESDSVEMDIKDGVVSSQFSDAGDYSHYTYDVTLNYPYCKKLHYTISNLSSTKSAPVTTDITEGVYEAEKTETENGSVFQFAIKESDLWNDPEGDGVTITEVTQVNTSNPVTCEQRDGYVYVTAEKAGSIEFSLNLEDETGMTAVVSVKGKIKDPGVKRKVMFGVAGTGILAVIVVAVLALLERQKKKKRQRIFGELQELAGKVDDSCSKCEMQIKELETQKAQLTEYLEGSSETDCDCIRKMAEDMDNELQTMFGVKNYLEENYCEKQFEDVETWKNSLRRIQSSMKRIKTYMDLEEKDLASVWDQVEKGYQAVNKKMLQINEIEENLKKKKEDIGNIIQNVEDLGEAMSQFAENEINCNLTVEDISCSPGAIYRQGAKVNGKNRHGGYKLGSIRRIIGTGTNTKILESTVSPLDIYVYGYEKEGLQLKGKNAFYIKNLNADETPVKTDHAVLLKGNTYKLTVENIDDLGKVSMNLTVG